MRSNEAVSVFVTDFAFIYYHIARSYAAAAAGVMRWLARVKLKTTFDSIALSMNISNVLNGHLWTAKISLLS